MQTQLIPYLSFSGNCRDAMKFYQESIGGDLNLQTIGDSPTSSAFAPEAHNNIMHSQLEKGSLTLMASDMGSPEGVHFGNGMSLMLLCESYDEAHSCFDALSKGGNIAHPLSEAFWGGIFGHLVDKFGVTWLVHAAKE